VAVKRAALLALFLVAACGTLGAQAQSISLAYKAGDTFKYGFHAVMKYTIAASGMSIPLNMDLAAKETVTVKSVDPSGTADLSVDISDVSIKMSMNGTTNTTTTNTGETIAMKVAKDGRVLSVNGNAFGSSSALPAMTGTQGGVVSAILPDHPVKPGDTWTKSYDQPNPLGTSAIHATSSNTYLRDESVGSIKTAVVESKVSTNLDMTIDLSAMLGAASSTPMPTGAGSGGVESLSMKGNSMSVITTWVDASARRIVKTHSSATVNATLDVNMAAGSTTPGLSGPITLKGTQTMDLTPA
jgi:hypothetical protein